MAQLNFDASTVDPNQAFDPLPAGWYAAQVTNSEMKPTSSGNGAYLQLEMTVLDGEFTGRKIFDRLNLQYPNPVAVEIAYKTLSAICHATNVMQVQDSAQLHGLPMEVKVNVRAAEGNYDASNDVKGYRAVGGGTGQQPAAPVAQAPQQAPAQAAPAPAGQAWPGQAPAQAAPAQGFAPQQAAPAAAPQQPWGAPQAQQPQQQPAATPQQQPAQAAPWGTQQQPAQSAPAAQQPAPTEQGMATGHPTQGPAPSAAGQPGSPPWGQPSQ